MVNDEMVDTIARRLTPGGEVFVQTDIEFLAGEMLDLFRVDGRFAEIAGSENPFRVKTEREKAVEDKQLPVFRSLFKKVSKAND